MRVLTGLLVLAAVAAVPSTARAESEPMCPYVPVDMAEAIEFQRPLVPYISAMIAVPSGERRGGEAGDAARTVLGAQFVSLRIDNVRKGWTVAYSPGAHDATTARAAIREVLAARLDPAAVDYLDRLLLLQPTRYSRAELEPIQEQLFAVMQAEQGLFSMMAIGCGWSDAYRVEISVGDPETPELRARAEAHLAPFGDKVVVRYGTGWARAEPGIVPGPPPSTPLPKPETQQRPTPKVREFVTLPRTSRCARTVGAKPRAGLGVKRVRLQIGKRASAGKAPRIKLKSRRSQVTVTVTLADGSKAVEVLTYRRCS
jgi:hypothetical protein